MIVLAIETATEACSAALFHDGVILEQYRVAPREHHRLILGMLDSLLAESGFSLGRVDALAFGRGPGSFTGVRIAAGVVQGIAFAADLPVAPVSTLAALADEAIGETGVEVEYAFPCLDARMQEVYFALYRRDADGYPELLGEERVLPPQSVAFPRGSGTGIGSGWATYGERLRELAGNRLVTVLADRFPRARAVARLGARLQELGRSVVAEQALPVYLREDVVKKPVR